MVSEVEDSKNEIETERREQREECIKIEITQAHHIPEINDDQTFIVAKTEAAFSKPESPIPVDEGFLVY